MRDTYRAILEELLLHYEQFSALAAALEWQHADNFCMETALDAQRNLHLNVYTVAFPPGYVQTHFTEAFVQMLLTVIAMQEEWDPAAVWGSSTAEARRRFLNDELHTQHLLFSGRLRDMEPAEFAEHVFTCAIGCERKWVSERLDDAAKAMIDRFSGGWHLAVGALSRCTPCESNWLAMQGDEFLFVTYYEGWS